MRVWTRHRNVLRNTYTSAFRSHTAHKPYTFASAFEPIHARTVRSPDATHLHIHTLRCAVVATHCSRPHYAYSASDAIQTYTFVSRVASHRSGGGGLAGLHVRTCVKTRRTLHIANTHIYTHKDTKPCMNAPPLLNAHVCGRRPSSRRPELASDAKEDGRDG